jgi:hypothetical protein
MTARPIAFVREGDVPYQAITIILAAGETRAIPGTLRYLLLTAATDGTKLLVSFNGSSFYNLPTGEQLQDFEADGFWIQNTDVAPNTVTLTTGMASLNAQHVVIDSSSPLTVTLSGTSPVSSVDLGVKADTVATTDTGTFSLIALFKRLLAKFDVLTKSVYSVNALATTNAAVVKASAGRVHSIQAFNAAAATKYVRLYDKASAPTVGTDIAMRVIAIPATSSKEIAFPGADTYANGIAIAITGAAAATDATAVAAGDVQLTINYV